MKKLITIFRLLTIGFSILILYGESLALDVKRTVLPNGLTVLHVERHNLPIVTVSLLIKASPFNEPSEKAGLSNLTSELLMEGTKKRKASDISEEIEFIGASLDTSTGSDFSTVNLLVLKKDLEKGFEILSDIILNPLFSEDEIKRKKELIIGKLKQSEDDPSFIANRAFKKAVYGNQPYGRLVTGTEETINKITRDDLIRFHFEYYRPNNSILSVVGNLTDSELKEIIERYFGKWESRDVPLAKKEASTERKKEGSPKNQEIFWGKREVLLVDKDLTQANILIGHSGIKRENPDYYAVSVMNYILGGGGFSSRLMQSIRDEMGLAYDIYSLFDARKEGGYFYVSVQTKNASANKVIDEILKQIDRIRTEPVSDQELDDAKAYLTGSFPRRFDTNKKIADMLLAMEYYNLGHDYISKYPEHIKSVTKDDIIRVARKYLDTNNYILVVVAKQSEAKIENR